MVQFEKFCRVSEGGLGGLFDGKASHLCDLFRDMPDIGRFVSLSPVGVWGEEGGVGLGEDPVERDCLDDLEDLFSILEGDHA